MDPIERRAREIMRERGVRFIFRVDATGNAVVQSVHEYLTSPYFKDHAASLSVEGMTLSSLIPAEHNGAPWERWRKSKYGAPIIIDRSRTVEPKAVEEQSHTVEIPKKLVFGDISHKTSRIGRKRCA